MRNAATRAARTATDSAMDIGALIDEHRDELLLTAAPKQARAAAHALRRFLWAEQLLTPSQITAGVIRRHLASLALDHSIKSLHNLRSIISGFCAFLAEPGRALLPANPALQVRLAKPERRPARYLLPNELALALSIADGPTGRPPWDARGCGPEVRLALATGLRLSELIRLKWGDVDVSRRTLLVRKSKNRKPRSVPLSPAACAALDAQRAAVAQKTHPGAANRFAGPGQSVGFEHVFPGRWTWRGGWRYEDRPRGRDWWLEALHPMQAAIPKFRDLPGSSTGRGWHLFRHTFASRLAQAGVSLYKIAAWMGHGSIQATEIYAHLQAGYDADIEAAMPVGPEARKTVGPKSRETVGPETVRPATGSVLPATAPADLVDVGGGI